MRPLAWACLAVLLTGCAGRPTLIVATEAAFEPFNTLDDHGRPVGFEIDLVNEIASITGDDVEFLIQPEFARLFDEIDAGRADLIASTVSITEQRRAAYLFSRPYYHTGVGVLARRDAGLDTLDDLADRRVGASAATTSVDAAERHGAMEIIEFRFSSDAVDALRAGDIDAYLVDTVEAARLQDGDIVLLPEPASNESYALLTARGRENLVARMNAALLVLEETGRLDELRAAYALD